MRELTIMFMPESADGPTNDRVGTVDLLMGPLHAGAGRG
jgi:hypothetical protein